MNIEDLKKQLEVDNIKESLYSLDGSLKSDSMILYNSYSQWEVFYLDERGNRGYSKIFDNESDACAYIYKILKENKDIADEYNLNY